MDLREALLMALREAGIGVLRQPSRLLSYVLDFADSASPVAAAFERNCDEELLGPLVYAAERADSEAISLAGNKMTRLLESSRQLKSDVARRISAELGFAVAVHVGVAVPEWMRDVVSTRGAVADDVIVPNPVPAPMPTPMPAPTSGLVSESVTESASSSLSEPVPESLTSPTSSTAAPPTPAQTTREEKPPALDRSVRSRYALAKSEGVGMLWYRVLACLCFAKAALCLNSAIQGILFVRALTGHVSVIDALFVANLVVQLVLLPSFFMLWIKLITFRGKSSGPFLSTFLFDAVWVPLLNFWVMYLANGNVVPPIEAMLTPQERVVFVVQVSLTLVSWVYLRRRDHLRLR